MTVRKFFFLAPGANARSQPTIFAIVSDLYLKKNVSNTSNKSDLSVSGAYTPIHHLSLKGLLPDTEHYMTYEGSTTHPGCWETTVWIIINKPIYITRQEMYVLRKLMQGSKDVPKAPLWNNARPLQPLHHRTVRTNIDFKNTEIGLSVSKIDYYVINK
ncbi:hypothetical protein AAG570_008238 [Ranatra chinensis]|uniref:Alpha-carbonic anhydrase domain-containing protein n=1 Tax=Ranatra chinensis TaxID=642074 RepID=A0ABD0XSL1_9HEMI